MNAANVACKSSGAALSRADIVFRTYNRVEEKNMIIQYSKADLKGPVSSLKGTWEIVQVLLGDTSQ